MLSDHPDPTSAVRPPANHFNAFAPLATNGLTVSRRVLFGLLPLLAVFRATFYSFGAGSARGQRPSFYTPGGQIVPVSWSIGPFVQNLLDPGRPGG